MALAPPIYAVPWPEWAGLAAYFIAAFFLGALPNAYFAGKIKGIDIRRHGSGNVGATNAFRVLGKGPGSAVFLLDFLKGAAPAWLLIHFFPYGGHRPLIGFLAGLTAMLGHTFTPFLGFKGGKGIATGAGALCAAFPLFFLISLGSWLLSFFISRIVSLSSLISVSILIVSVFCLEPSAEVRGVFTAGVLLVFWTHRANISRLIRGEEKGFGKPNK